jgi:hypothetical protein
MVVSQGLACAFCGGPQKSAHENGDGGPQAAE